MGVERPRTPALRARSSAASNTPSMWNRECGSPNWVAITAVLVGSTHRRVPRTPGVVAGRRLTAEQHEDTIRLAGR